MPELLEAEWVTRSNSEFHLIAEKLRTEVGAAEADRVFKEWEKWIKEKLKKAEK